MSALVSVTPKKRSPVLAGLFLPYRYRGSNPGFRRERESNPFPAISEGFRYAGETRRPRVRLGTPRVHLTYPFGTREVCTKVLA